MRLFTSSFERAPKSRYRTEFAIVILVAVGVLASMEYFWRERGAAPGYVDDMRRWSYYRDQVGSLTDKDATILIGRSRIQLGFSMGTFRSIMPKTPVIQLAIDGVQPFAILRDLSRNTNFKGVVIISLIARGILPGEREEAQSYVDFYHKSWRTNTKINFLIDDFLQRNLVTRQYIYGFFQTTKDVLKGDFQRGKFYVEMTRERDRNADYLNLDILDLETGPVRRQEARWENFQRPSRAIWDQSVNDLDQIVRPMIERGARVVFVRFPSSGESWQLEKKMFPRERYWDDLARRVAGYWIHFEDIDGMESFVLPDTSHLDWRDKAAFTRLLMSKLRELGVY